MDQEGAVKSKDEDGQRVTSKIIVVFCPAMLFNLMGTSSEKRRKTGWEYQTRDRPGPQMNGAPLRRPQRLHSTVTSRLRGDPGQPLPEGRARPW